MLMVHEAVWPVNVIVVFDKSLLTLKIVAVVEIR